MGAVMKSIDEFNNLVIGMYSRQQKKKNKKFKKSLHFTFYGKLSV